MFVIGIKQQGGALQIVLALFPLDGDIFQEALQSHTATIFSPLIGANVNTKTLHQLLFLCLGGGGTILRRNMNNMILKSFPDFLKP